ncbi:MAG: hypothetical protein ACOZIN_14295 [Myxococcota bacterium]
MAHLDENLLEALFAQPAVHRELVEHLAQGCEVCDTFLEKSGPSLLDGLADALLLEAAGPRSSPFNEVGWRRVERARRRPRRFAVAGVAASLLAAGIAAIVFVRPPDEDKGIKANAGRLVLELSAAAQSPDGTVRRVSDGARVRPDDVIVFRAHSSEAGVAALWLQSADSKPRLLGEVPLEAGTNDLRLRGELAGVSLAGESGSVTVWVVASRTPTSLGPAEALHRIDSGASRDVAVGRLVLHVEP